MVQIDRKKIANETLYLHIHLMIILTITSVHLGIHIQLRKNDRIEWNNSMTVKYTI